MRAKTLSLLALVLVFGCDGSSSVKKVDSGSDPSNPAVGCPATLVGTWILDSVSCGGVDVTGTIASQGGVTDMHLRIDDNGTSCSVTGTLVGPTCTEIEEGTLVADEEGTYVLVPQGITDCQPAGCRFNASDLACALGDRANETGMTSFDLSYGVLTMTTQPPAGLCGSYGAATGIAFTKS